MVVLCAMTGGYTEASGWKCFLEKIRPDITYKRILPGILKPGPKKGIALKPKDQGISGSSLLAESLRRLRVHEDASSAAALLLWDDLDCKPLHEGSFSISLRDFTAKLQSISENIALITLFADPEIESWFCLDPGTIFKNNVPLCKQLKEYRISYFAEKKVFDLEKKSCKHKFSDGFRDVLFDFEIDYSKKEQGAAYLRLVHPEKISRQDGFVKTACIKLQNLK